VQLKIDHFTLQTSHFGVLWLPFPILGSFIFGNKDGEDGEVTEYGYGTAIIGNNWF